MVRLIPGGTKCSANPFLSVPSSGHEAEAEDGASRSPSAPVRGGTGSPTVERSGYLRSCPSSRSLRRSIRERSQEGVTKTTLLFLIPERGIPNLGFSLWPEDDTEELMGVQSRAGSIRRSASSSGTAASGSERCAAERRWISSIRVGVRGSSSGRASASAAMLSQRSSTS